MLSGDTFSPFSIKCCLGKGENKPLKKSTTEKKKKKKERRSTKGVKMLL
jgi:hypothetical protein